MAESVSNKLRRSRLLFQIINMQANKAKQELEILELEERIGQGQVNIEATDKAIIELQEQLAQFQEE